MSEHTPADDHHLKESPVLHAQEHKGYGDDEGEREQLLGSEVDGETKASARRRSPHCVDLRPPDLELR